MMLEENQNSTAELFKEDAKHKERSCKDDQM